MEAIEYKITDTHTSLLKEKEDEEEKALADDEGKTLEVVIESSPCNCLACTTSTPMCKLRKDGCRHCYDLYASTSSHTRGTGIQTERGLHTNITTPPLTNTANTATIYRQQCLFRCCIQESRMVKDLYVRELDRILSAAFTQTSMTNAMFRTSSTSPMLLTDSTTPPTIESQSLPIGTEVLCCWHWNGRRCWGSVVKSKRCIPTHWNEPADPIVYSIRFSDGRIRDNVQRNELLSTSNWECEVWVEQLRLLRGEQASATMSRAFYKHCSAMASVKTTKKRPLPNMTETPSSTKQDHYQQRKSKRLSPRLSFQELFYHRCRTCHLCRLPDCGECESCAINRTSTSIHRNVCVLHMCAKIPIASKQQEAMYGWNYFFETPFTQRTQSINNLPSCYQQLRLVAPSSSLLNQCNHDTKPKSYSIFSALHALSSDQLRVEFGSFFEALTGQPLNERCSHPLTSRRYVHEYSNRNDTSTNLSGTISKCWKHFIHRTLSFTVTFDTLQSSLVNMPTASPNYNCKAFTFEEIVSEQMAWGGHKKYCQQHHSYLEDQESNSLLVAPYSVNWMIPSKQYIVHSLDHRNPDLMLEFRNCLLQFETKPSTIKGAGTGLFVKAVNGKSLVLQPGEMLDLGIYAPLQVGNIKPKHVSMLKNLIYDWSIEAWSFAEKRKSTQGYTYDPTDDFTGTLDLKAKSNLISYINETCQSNEVANISAQHDPEGNVHYLLGHWEENENKFTISSDQKPLELLIDYGPSYERCRLRNGYSRLSPNCTIDKSVIKAEDDVASIADFANFSYNQLKDCLTFLEDIYLRGCNLNERNLHLSLIAAFALEDRLKEIVNEFDGFSYLEDEFCDGGVSSMITTETEKRFKNVITAILMTFRFGAMSNATILSITLLRNAVFKRIGDIILEPSCPRNGAMERLLELYQ